MGDGVKDLKCPECDGPATKLKKSKTGNEFYSCDRFPKCKGLVNVSEIGKVMAAAKDESHQEERRRFARSAVKSYPWIVDWSFFTKDEEDRWTIVWQYFTSYFVNEMQGYLDDEEEFRSAVQPMDEQDTIPEHLKDAKQPTQKLIDAAKKLIDDQS